MSAALAYEWTRIRTIRSTWWLTALTLVLGVGLAFLVSWGMSVDLGNGNTPGPQERPLIAPMIVGQFAGQGAPLFIAYVIAMVGVFAWGHEYRHGMIRATLTALSSRTSAWAAKYVVVALWAAGTALLTMLLSAAVGWLWLRDDGISFATGDVAQVLVATAAYTVLFTWVAAALASLIRQQAAALVLMFLWPLALENVITLVLSVVPGLEALASWSRFLPYNAGARMLSVGDRSGGALFGDPLSPWGGLLVFGAFAAVLLGASLVLFRERDA